jgi:hypothetical protein
MGAREASETAASEAGREALRAAQEALLASLVAGGPAPAGFDPDGLEAARRSLLSKRARVVARCCPALHAALGEGFGAAFAAYAAEAPLRQESGGRDGLDFMDWLARRGALPEPAREERAIAQARHRGGLAWVRRDGRWLLAWGGLGRLRVWRGGRPATP